MYCDDEKLRDKNKDLPKARPYQDELLMTAKEKNTLICLGTGAGKTYIAIMLISHFSHEIEPPYDENGKRTFFLVPTRPLVKQQASEIIKKSRFNENDVGEITGDMNVDFWSKELWLKHLRSKKIFVMTRQIFLNILNYAIIPLNKVNLLIFDEAHHAALKQKKKGGPKETKDCYKQIMDYIKLRPESEQPRILGLSASLINANNRVNELTQTISDLELTYKSTCTSVADLEEVRKYATDPKRCIWQYEEEIIGVMWTNISQLINSASEIFQEMEDYKSSISRVNKKRKFLENKEEKVKIISPSISVGLPIGVSDFRKCVTVIGYALKTMGPWCAKEACNFYINEFKNIIELCKNTTPLYCEILSSINDILQNIQGLINFFFYSHQATLGDMLLKYTSNKMKRLLDLLLNYENQEENELAGIIFVERRVICIAMCNWLQKITEIDDKYKFLKVDYVVGASQKPGLMNKIAVKTAQKQRESLIQFRRSKTNLLVATSVLEEGLDVPQCNLVVRYNGVNTYREWVQSQGRARSQNGHFVIFSESQETLETIKMCETYQEMAEQIQNECQIATKIEHSPSIPTALVPDDEKPLVHPMTGARITLDTAKSIVFMYCNRLPSDTFFFLSPVEEIEEVTNQGIVEFRCKIQLPINSPFKLTFQGPVKETKSKASKTAYLKVCRVLHEHDEIDELFIPYSKTVRLKKIIEQFNLSCTVYEDLNSENIGPKPGTVKRSQIYSKKLVTMFGKDVPLITSTFKCLYSINVIPRTTVQSIGFICSQHIPFDRIVSSFPVYIKTAEYKISITTIDTQFTLSSHQLRQIQSFHQVVFHESLGYKRSKLQFDEASPVYVVPLNEQLIVDWDIIQVTLARNEYNAGTDHNEKRKKFLFKDSDFIDVLVYKWYDPVGLFEVLEVKKSMNSSCQLPNNKDGYRTYIDYYNGKYNLQIVHPSYPLLTVDSIGFNSSIKRVEPTKTKKKRRPILLVPELVTIFPISNSLHRQCRLLPAVFYRLCQVYNVELLRQRIANEANIGWKSFPIACNWGELNFDCDKINFQEQKNNPSVDNYPEIGHTIDSESDDYEEPEIHMKDSKEHKIAEKQFQSEATSKTNIEVIESNQKLLFKPTNNTLTTKRSTDDPRLLSFLPSNIYGDTDALQRKYSDFSVDTYVNDMKTTLLTSFKTLLEGNRNYYDPGDHSQYLTQNSGTKTFTSIDNRLESFDDSSSQYKISGPSPSLLLQTLTTKKAIDMFSMERLETLGDSFLKLTTSSYFYYKFPVLNEGYLSALKVNQISNYNLYRLAKQKDLSDYMIARQFQPSNNWLPPGFRVEIENEIEMKNSGKRYDEFTQQEIADKSIADSCEAMIGAYLLASGPQAAVKYMTWLGIRVLDPEMSDVDNHWLPSPRSGQATDSGLDSQAKIHNLYLTLAEFEKYIGYEFRDKCFLIQAMTHVSYHDNTVTDCYQRLEFLGDAVLDYLITRYIYEDPKQFQPGDLTDLRAALTNNSFFGSLAVKHNFHVHLKMNSYELFRSIHSFADKIKDKITDVVYGNFMHLLDEREASDMEETDVPKALGDIFESVAGAIYLDSNYSMDAVWKIYYPLFNEELEEFSKNIPRSPLTLLYIKFPLSVTFSKATVLSPKQVRLTLTIDHESCKCSVDGYGKNRYWAKNSAAKRALKQRSEALK